MVCHWPAAQRKFGEQQTPFGDLTSEFRVAPWIDDIDTGTQHGDRCPDACKAAAVCCRVDAHRHARYDAEARFTQCLREALGVVLALRAGIPAAHDGEATMLQELNTTHRVEQSWRIGYLKKRSRIAFIRERDHAMTRFIHPFQSVRHRSTYVIGIECFERRGRRKGS